MAQDKATRKRQFIQQLRGKIQARVSDFPHGLRVYEGIKLVRIRSKDYTLLIMEDYFPIIGKVYGHVELVVEDDLVDLGEVKGFFLHRSNEFSLLIEQQLAEPGQQEERDSGHDQ